MSAANDTARAVFFQTKSGATSYAVRLAQQLSRENCARQVEFVPGCFQPKEGGRAFEAAMTELDYVVREVPPAELARRVQSGMRGAVTSLYERAVAHDVAVTMARPEAIKGMHRRYAAECRSQAREIETRLVMSGVRAVVVSETSNVGAAE